MTLRKGMLLTFAFAVAVVLNIVLFASAALLSRDYRIGAFVVQFMTDKSLGDLSRYIITSPPFIL